MRASLLFLVPTRLLVNSNSARYPAFRLHSSVTFHEITPIPSGKILHIKNNDIGSFAFWPQIQNRHITIRGGYLVLRVYCLYSEVYFLVKIYGLLISSINHIKKSSININSSTKLAFKSGSVIICNCF